LSVNIKFVNKRTLKNLIVFILLFSAVFFAQAVLAADFGTEAVNNGLEGTLSDSDPRSLVGRIINIALGFLGVISIGIIIWGGFVWMMSNGEEEKISNAKKILRNGVIGLVIVLASWAIATFIITRLAGTGGAGPGGCQDGSTSYCGCGGSMVCFNGSWGSCVGSDCGGNNGPTACDSSPDPGCQAENAICSESKYCDDDCSCKPRGGLGDSCDADLDNGSCDADDNRCAEYLSCDEDTCTCFGPPVITEVSPIGGFCQDEPNVSCIQDEDCPSVCNITTPNGASDNLVTIFGKNFGEYSEENSKVVFLGAGSPAEALNPTEINPECIDTWKDNQIIVAVPSGVGSGAIKVVNIDNLEDSTADDYGPQIDDFVANNIVRPGLCSLDPTQGALSHEINYQGINLYTSNAYFGNYQENIAGLDSDFNNPAGLLGTAIIPNIRTGESSSFVVNNVSGNQEKSNYLRFFKEEEEGEGPYIMSFYPSQGKAGQYVTIKGSGFGGAKGNNHVYFGEVEASYDFPAICVNSVWEDDQIIVKVPSSLEEGNYLIRITLGNDIIDTQSINPNIFTIDNNSALKTSLCRIDPERGPVHTPVTVYGEYFGQSNSEGTVQFSPGSEQKIYGQIEKKDSADIITVEVPEGATTGPVKVVKNNSWGNELNFEVAECRADDDCGTQVCCPQNTYRKGRCVGELSECFVDIPNSVFEWSFNTKFNTSTTTPFDSCKAMASYYGDCQTGAFCPNTPGVCSPYLGGNRQVVGECDYSCDTVPGCDGLGSSSCNYDVNLDKCVKEGNDGICDLDQTLGQASITCNEDERWQISTSASCPDGWERQANDICINPHVSCHNCDDGLACELIGSRGRCVSDKICSNGAVCEDNPDITAKDQCVVTDSADCDCCCRIGQSATDCCAPLQCAGTCGEDTSDDGAGYGVCSGCAGVGSTAEERDAACNCTGHGGQYCDVNTENPEGVCVDCSSLGTQESCNEHSAYCCFDSNNTSDSSDDICRSGSGQEISDDPSDSSYGYCAYYSCQDDDPNQCASTEPAKLGVFKDIDSCESGCAEDPGVNYCSKLNGDLESCLAETECCFDEESTKCLGADRIASGDYAGYCAYYDCQTNDPSQCNLNADTIGRYTDTEACALGCANHEGGVGQSCNSFLSVSECAPSSCNYPGFACLDYSGSLNTYPDCGTCCCDPGQPEMCQTPEGPDLYCAPDKGSCSGANRGLCCGCSLDLECGNQASVGCGNDSCCEARPDVISSNPENLSKKVCRNVAIKVDFDQAMSFTTFNSNVLLLEEGDYVRGVCPEGTFISSNTLSEIKTIKKKRNWFNSLSMFVGSLFNRTSNSALAEGPSVDKLYCSIPGSVSEEKLDSRTSLIFSPKKLLSPDTDYYLVVMGDEDLNSQSGILSASGIGMNGQGLGQSDGTYLEGENLKFNRINYDNSHIIKFTTLSDQGEKEGVCAIDNLKISPSSYLFKTTTNDLNENDEIFTAVNFDVKADRDKMFSVNAYSANDQIVKPVTSYSWSWDWGIDNGGLIDLKENSDWGANRIMATAQEGITDGETKLWATVDMSSFSEGGGCDNSPNCSCSDETCPENCCNLYFPGDNLAKDSELYIFICNNPWPPVDNNGEWHPWKDNCEGATGGNCADFNYKFYYCRDAGEAGTLDDLPAIIDEAVIKGQSDSLICSVDREACSTLNSSCGPDRDGNGSADGMCIWNVLKESYFFREAVLPAGEITDASNTKTGGKVNISWNSLSAQVDSYRIYYYIEGQSGQSKVEEVKANDACRKVLDPGNERFICETEISNLANGKNYIFKLSVISVNQTESQLSNEKSAIPMDQTAPAVPINLKAEVIDDTMKFSWKANSDDTLLYRLYRGIKEGQYGESSDSADLTPSLTFSLYELTGISYFALSAVDSYDNESAKSAEIAVEFPPSTPLGLEVKIINEGESLQFSWQANTDNVSSYRLYQGINSDDYSESYNSNGLNTVLTPSLDHFNDVNYFALSAVDGNGNESRKSDEIKIRFP